MHGAVMKYCTKCLQPDTKPNDYFSKDGVCSGCLSSFESELIDWEERYELLKSLVARFPRRHGQRFDCLIGVSGGKDSLRQALWVRDRLGLKPLLVCLSYPPQQVTQVGTDNISNLIELGFDVIWSAPAPEIWRQLMRVAFLKFTNFGRSTELALYSLAPQIAIRYGIPLIFTGENQGLRDRATLINSGWDYNAARKQNTLNDGNLQWIEDAGFQRQNYLPYVYPEEATFDAANLQIIDLGWFIKDWNNIDNGSYSATYGLSMREDSIENTGDPLGISALDEDWVAVNQMIKFYKFGFGKATDYVNEDIRLGRLSRNNAISFVEKYDGVCSKEYINSYCDYLSLTHSQFWQQIYSCVNPQLFDIGTDGSIKSKFKVGVGL
jgi:N-acetyl sugar amidotransferase